MKSIETLHVKLQEEIQVLKRRREFLQKEFESDKFLGEQEHSLFEELIRHYDFRLQWLKLQLNSVY